MNSQPDEVEAVRRVFHQYVPEVASGIVEIRGIVRQPGKRSIVSVFSKDRAVEPIGTCLGDRNSRVKSIVAQLQGEMIDIVLWSDSVGIYCERPGASSRRKIFL